MSWLLIILVYLIYLGIPIMLYKESPPKLMVITQKEPMPVIGLVRVVWVIWEPQLVYQALPMNYM